MRHKIITFVKKETILVISLLLAAISSCFVFPDKEYLSYIDWHTLMLLFSLMAVMAGYQKLGLFKVVGANLLSRTKHTKQLSLILVFLPFFFSMLITNDVALITFVPFAIIVLRMAKLEHRIVPIVILQTIAANLGSMLTPMGNPQNLYLYAQSHMGIGDFLLLMLPYTVVAAICLLIACLFGKKEELGKITFENDVTLSIIPSLSYGILFFLCLLCVADIVDVKIVLICIVVYLFLFDRSIYSRIDYSLLGTFIGFFIFIGNMERISAFRSFIEHIVSGHEVIVSILSSQIISNVPSALLLSGFTSNFKALIIGTNLGGLGTLIASMASLISYKQIAREYPDDRGCYLRFFSIANLLMLALLLGLMLLL